ncbi:MAG: LysM peptidoglycan-binding domain-containing M23 family metallopeptidase [bacterium]|nr:LysM peptidoglycan-binding domain-containing M23 family metallopeptidase [bacterium]
MSHNPYEPEIDLLDDTHPSLSMRPVGFKPPQKTAGWRRLVGLLSLLGAMGFTLATIAVLMIPSAAPVAVPTQAVSQAATSTTMPTTEAATDLPSTPVPQTESTAQAQLQLLPTVDPALAAALLATPLAPQPLLTSMRIERSVVNPFTIIPDRPRNEIIQYRVERGDTINSIAERFGLRPETVAWSNDRRIVQVLREGDLVNIPPVDGVLVTVVGTQNTIAALAQQYQVDDPFIILESEFNNLRGLTPESVPPSGTQIFIPGGIAEEISWRPAVQREEGGGGPGGSSGGFITFAPGEAGSCGRVANPGGGAAWIRPVDNYSVSHGYSGWHTAIDLAGAVGVPVKAANGGRVIFAGWNSFGYGYTIVLAHGPYTTLYGHLSDIYVRCGQDVAPGQNIAAMGNSGNSSGPHLHFEIRYNDAPQDPSFTIPF